jgi:ABC-type amino acid transport substrate-binding protein
MNSKSKLSLLLVGIVATCAAFLFRNVYQSRALNTQDTFIVGTSAGYAPYASINEQGEYEGFDIDVARAIAEKLNKKLVLKDLGSMTSLMMGLDQKSLDAIIWGVSITEARLKKYTMIHYQGSVTDSYPLLFWQKAPADIKMFDDLKGLKICVEPSSSQSAALGRYSNINILPVERVDDALLNIQYGKADAALVEYAIANKFARKFPEIKIVSLALNPEDQEFGCGIVLEKENNALSQKIQRIIDELKADGTLQRLAKQWNLE